MTYDRSYHPSMSPYTNGGERKYLCASERERFIKALPVLTNPKDRTYCECILMTGCRASEALGLTALHIDAEEGAIIIRSLKKRNKTHFRAVPVPRSFIERLDEVHHIRKSRAMPGGGRDCPLWTFSRTTGWLRMKEVMKAAGLSGVKATSKGLRHSYGVNCALNHVPTVAIKRFLGHSSLQTSEVYLDFAHAEDDRKIVRRLWG
ncbi:MAG: site-specific integrase [Pseudomonadota bacterium]